MNQVIDPSDTIVSADMQTSNSIKDRIESYIEKNRTIEKCKTLTSTSKLAHYVFDYMKFHIKAKRAQKTLLESTREKNLSHSIIKNLFKNEVDAKIFLDAAKKTADQNFEERKNSDSDSKGFEELHKFQIDLNRLYEEDESLKNENETLKRDMKKLQSEYDKFLDENLALASKNEALEAKLSVKRTNELQYSVNSLVAAYNIQSQLRQIPNDKAEPMDQKSLVDIFTFLLEKSKNVELYPELRKVMNEKLAPVQPRKMSAAYTSNMTGTVGERIDDRYKANTYRAGGYYNN